MKYLIAILFLSALASSATFANEELLAALHANNLSTAESMFSEGTEGTVERWFGETTMISGYPHQRRVNCLFEARAVGAVKLERYLLKTLPIEAFNDALHYAAVHNLAPMGTAIIDTIRPNRPTQAWNLERPFYEAARNGNAQMLPIFVDAGVSPNFTPESGAGSIFYSPVVAAARNGHWDAMATILRLGGSLEQLQSEFGEWSGMTAWDLINITMSGPDLERARTVALEHANHVLRWEFAQKHLSHPAILPPPLQILCLSYLSANKRDPLLPEELRALALGEPLGKALKKRPRRDDRDEENAPPILKRLNAHGNIAPTGT